MPDPEPSYEALREFVRGIQPAAQDARRQVRWVDDGHSVGVARDGDGGLELFLVGEQLTPRSPIIRDAMQFDRWTSADGTTVPANRLVLPAGAEYDSATAVICVELLDREYAQDQALAFRSSESLIELFLTQAASENAVLTGLAGELQLLAALLRGGSAGDTTGLVRSWRGWERSTRDFQLGQIGVEVKTTTTGASVHPIQGWYQVELGLASDGGVETELHLLSQGIRWLAVDADRGTSIEALTVSIAERLSGTDRAEFLKQVRGYVGASFDIDDSGHSATESLRRRFVPTFERLYDLADGAVQLPQSRDFAHLSHLQMDSVRFTAQLPERVRGDLNPVTNLQTITESLLERAWRSGF